MRSSREPRSTEREEEFERRHTREHAKPGTEGLGNQGHDLHALGNRALLSLLRSKRLQRKEQASEQFSGGRALDEITRDVMESRFGEDFSNVRIHTGQSAAQSADAMESRAFTVGEDIVFAQGEFAPETLEGRHLLAHELAHVVQQRRPAGPIAGEDEAERDAHDAAHDLAGGAEPRVRKRAAMGAVQKQRRPPEELRMLDELKRLDAEAEVSSLMPEKEKRREFLREELHRRDEARLSGRVPSEAEPFGPPPPPKVTQPEGSKKRHDFRVQIKDNELIATLNGNVVARGWIGANVGVAVEENYGEDPLHYYVTLWIDGEHDVKHDAGAISAFREVAEDTNFYIRRTSRSLQEHPLGRTMRIPPRNAPAKLPPKPPVEKPLPKIIVPPQSTDDPYAPFLESDKEPPKAYFTPRVLNLREHMARGDSDVEDLATELSLPEMRSLKFDERVRLIRWIADNWFVGDEKERTLYELIDTTPEPDAARLLAELRAQGSQLLLRLDSVIDGEEYIKFHEALRRLYLRSLTPDQTLSKTAEARNKGMVWADPGLITFFKGGRVTYKITQNKDGTIHVRRWLAAPMPFAQMEVPPVDLDPFEMVAVYFKYGEDLLGGSKGSVVYMPAANLLLLENKEFKQDMELAVNVGMVFGGGAGIVGATSRVALAVAIAELTVGAANIVVDNYKSELEKSPAGARFLRAWEVVNLLFAAYSVGKTVRAAPKALRELRDAYSAFKAAKGSMDPATAAKVEQEMAKVLHDTEEVEKALAQEAHGDIHDPPSGKGPFDIPEDVGYDNVGPLVEQVAAPPASELARTMDESLARSKVFEKWIAPKQAAGRTATKLGVRVLPDNEYVEFRAKLLEGQTNPKTGKPFTDAERRAFAQKSRGYTDPTGKVTFPASRFEPGNEIHEGLHQLQSPEFRNLGRNVSEGATEYFTMIIANEQGLPRNYMKYQELRPLVYDMAQVGGFDNVAEAYFNGDLSKVKAVFDGKKPGLWDAWLKLCKQGKISEARQLLAPFYD